AGFIVRLDAHRFREVVDNLLSNAVKYTPPGGSISVEVEGTETYARVSVQDSGPGFSPADRAGLFRPFQRLSARPTGGEPSTGLGLAIVKQVVDLHEGDIRVESPPAGGARLTVTLPVAQPRALPLAA
ncbi:MAG TPA: ATP-binding protein, partial [Rhodothermales bacterium]|nr:ATP-binding protein [Rhodothermales bacterium]